MKTKWFVWKMHIWLTFPPAIGNKQLLPWAFLWEAYRARVTKSPKVNHIRLNGMLFVYVVLQTLPLDAWKHWKQFIIISLFVWCTCTWSAERLASLDVCSLPRVAAALLWLNCFRVQILFNEMFTLLCRHISSPWGTWFMSPSCDLTESSSVKHYQFGQYYLTRLIRKVLSPAVWFTSYFHLLLHPQRSLSE